MGSSVSRSKTLSVSEVEKRFVENFIRVQAAFILREKPDIIGRCRTDHTFSIDVSQMVIFLCAGCRCSLLVKAESRGKTRGTKGDGYALLSMDIDRTSLASLAPTPPRVSKN